VADEENGEPQPLREILKEAQHLAGDEGVERGGDLVADQEVGLGGERPREV
jgi:hypothetical protein